MIDISEVPLDLLRPGAFVFVDPSLAFEGLPVFSQRMVIFGQMFTAGAAAGTAAPLTFKIITRDEEADISFGPGSIAARAARALRKNNAYHELHVMGLADDGAATAATGSIAFTVQATRPGTATFRIAGQRVQIAVKTSDTVTALATKLETAVNADKQLPVTAVAALGVVTLTARWAGETGNAIDVRYGYFKDGEQPSGLAVTITAMATGATNPDVTDAIAAMDALETYDTFVNPYTDTNNLDVLEAELADRFTATRAVDGVAFSAFAGTYANSATLADGRNSPFTQLCLPGLTPTAPWEVAAAMAGVTTYADGTEPGRPYQTLALDGVQPPDPGVARFDDQERQLLLTKGGGTVKVDAGGRVVIERAVTSYKTTASGAADPSLRDLNTLRLMSYYRRSVVNTWQRKFPRHKLAGNDQPVNLGQAIMTPAGAKAEMIAHYEKLVSAGLFQDLAAYKDTILVEIDANQPGRLNIFDRPKPIGQLRQTAMRAAFRL